MILCIGTTPTLQRTMKFDRLTPDDVNRAAAVHEHASGKAVNVARVLHTLGEHASALGFAGGRRGDALLEDLARSQVPHDFVPTHRQTRLCTTLIDRATSQVTELVEEPPPASQQEWSQLITTIERHLPAATTLVLSGTLAPGAPKDFLARWISPGRRTVVDAKGPHLRLALQQRGCIAKLNQQELSQTLGRTIDSGSTLLALARQHTPTDGLMIVTQGPRGALATDGRHAYRAHPAPITPLSPIGSGDAFAAGLAAALTRGQDLPAALQLATACAAANALSPYSGVLTKPDVDRLLPEVRIEPIA
jgi:tagatose 6-phosphate kinase